MVADKKDACRNMNVVIFDKLDFSFATLLLKMIYKVKAKANGMCSNIILINKRSDHSVEHYQSLSIF